MKPVQTTVKNRAIKRHGSRQLTKKEPRYVDASRYSNYDDRVRLINFLDHAARVRTKNPDAKAKEVWPAYWERVVGTLEADGVFGYASTSSELARLAAGSGESDEDDKLSEEFETWDASWED